MTSALAANSASSAALAGVAGTEEGVLGAAEPLPQLVVDVLGRRAGRLPLPHQVAVAARGRAPVGRVGERLGLLGQPLLDHAGGLPLLVLLGEVRLAAPGVRRPRAREPRHSASSDGPVDAGAAPSTRRAGRAAGWRRRASRCRRRASRPRRRCCSLATLASATFCARSASRASRWPLDHRAAARRAGATSAARSPTALASVDLRATRSCTDCERLLGRHHAGADPLLEQLDLERERRRTAR